MSKATLHCEGGGSCPLGQATGHPACPPRPREWTVSFDSAIPRLVSSLTKSVSYRKQVLITGRAVAQPSSLLVRVTPPGTLRPLSLGPQGPREGITRGGRRRGRLARAGWRAGWTGLPRTGDSRWPAHWASPIMVSLEH